jgi:predicted transposase YbfD/YdcC
VGLAGAAQLIRIDRKTEFLRRGRVVKTTHDTVYLITSLWADEAGPDKLLALVREYWAIEIKQHYRRDHTQREDHCHVRHTVAARVLSLMRSLSIFLFESQRGRPKAKRSLPDWLRRNHRNPNPLVTQLIG